MNEKARETITKYLGDMHALESHGLQAISRQVDNLKDSGHTEALQAVTGFKHTLEIHVAALEARMKALGDSPTSPVKEAASVVAGVAAGLYNAVRTEEASKSIRDDYTFISNAAIAYLMLHTTSKGLGDSETATLAERGYRDAARMVMEIDRIMPGLVIQELKQDGLPVHDVAKDCEQMIHDAWQRGQGTMAGVGTSATSAGSHGSGTGGSGTGAPSGISTSPSRTPGTDGDPLKGTAGTSGPGGATPSTSSKPSSGTSSPGTPGSSTTRPGQQGDSSSR